MRMMSPVSEWLTSTVMFFARACLRALVRLSCTTRSTGSWSCGRNGSGCCVRVSQCRVMPAALRRGCMRNRRLPRVSSQESSVPCDVSMASRRSSMQLRSNSQVCWLSSAPARASQAGRHAKTSHRPTKKKYEMGLSILHPEPPELRSTGRPKQTGQSVSTSSNGELSCPFFPSPLSPS